MNKQYIRINNKTVTGYEAYGKMGLQVGSIFELQQITDTKIEFNPVGQPNHRFSLTLSLYGAEQFEIVSVLTSEDLSKVESDMVNKGIQSAKYAKQTIEQSQAIDRFLAQ